VWLPGLLAISIYLPGTFGFMQKGAELIAITLGYSNTTVAAILRLCVFTPLHTPAAASPALRLALYVFVFCFNCK